MDRNEIIAKVTEVACDVLGVEADSISEGTTFDELHADSLDRLQLVTALEDEFDIEFTEEALEKINSMADAVDAIAAAQEA